MVNLGQVRLVKQSLSKKNRNHGYYQMIFKKFNNYLNPMI